MKLSMILFYVDLKGYIRLYICSFITNMRIIL